MSEHILTRKHQAHKHHTHTHAAFGWRIHCGVEVTEVSTNKQHTLSIAVEWSSKVLYVLEFKRTSDQKRNYRERGEVRARAQHDVLVKGLEKVAGEAVGENSGWKIKLIMFV